MTTMIQLQRTVSVASFDIEATLAIGRDRPELLAVAQLARDLGRPIRGTDVATQLLGRLPEHVGWRVIDRCLDLGLLARQDDRGPIILSEAGEAALATGSVLIPEEGTWRLFTIEDPLVTVPLVHFARLDPPRASDEREELKNTPRDQKGRQRPPPSDPLSRALWECHRQGTVARSLAGGVPFQITDLPRDPKGARGPLGPLRLELTWTPGALAVMHVRGALPLPEARDPARQGKRGQRDGHSVDTTLPLPDAIRGVPFDELWFVLASYAGKVPITETREWFQRTGLRLLPTPFDGLDDNARTALRRDLPVPQANLGPAFGTFDPTTLDGVDLVPRTDQDAERWARWFQIKLLKDYVTPTTLERTNKEILAKFPHHAPQLVRPQELLNTALKDPRAPHSRFLLAPADLGLWR